MKLIGTLILFILLLGSAFAENTIEFHSHHDSVESHGSDIDYSVKAHHEDSKESKRSSDHQHYHVHCSNLCVGILIPHLTTIIAPSTLLSTTPFSHSQLALNNFSISLYRPPIA
jgi:hypothetical protein